MSDLDRILEKFPRPTWRPFAWSVIALCCAAASWAWTTELDRIAIAPGTVVPKGQVRIIQHLEGGVASEILVAEGDTVAAGDPLMRIELGGDALNGEELQARLDALALERARLIAEAAQIDLHLPEEESARQTDLARAETMTYRNRKREYESRIAVLRDQRSQKELEIESIAARLAGARARFAPLQEQREIAQHLSENQLMAKSQALTVERDYKTLEAEIGDLAVSLPLAQTALAEAKERELFERNRFRSEASERLRQVEIEMARQRELLTRANSQATRRLIVSPIDGIVKNLQVNTIGGVVGAGQPIAEIVPIGEELVIQARLSPRDVGHVSVGQTATVKIHTYDYMRYGALTGVVTQIAADASRDDKGEHYFRMILETDGDHLAIGDERYPISPGMSADIDIKLGKQTVARYLVEPVLKLRNEAFQAR